ncbi:hypothetical protein A3D11_03410 [Candidatus Peribacteria bacterium RIFCSPHIGHO2_02_FULL_49_16]|nr:MAG: hypothetical protein A2880_04370 [Candidatus Peribacteria bacterium RIFCSPHIGHO2_01_FULL_49_38]OGJ58785.1 MAG: hypothetical protein A3D11_03410 [Candidatus Peribacteria bacterium RIFCSPHIGHO2_02_FULL_49_16]
MKQIKVLFFAVLLSACIQQEHEEQMREETPPIEVIAEDLTIPWDMAFLPSGELLITERPGTLLILGNERRVIPIEDVHHRGEGGLLGVTLHPNFRENRWIYLYHTETANGATKNRVERYRLEDATLTNRTTIIDEIPGAMYHDGGRMEFGPDGLLYITTGDATQSNLAQEKYSLAGKILRVEDDGSIPNDNPFGTAVYSYGHRNPQGLTWDDEGRLWSTEHGRSGVQTGYDELNMIEPGKNYGWPHIQGSQTAVDMTSPILQSGASDTWAPASAAYHHGSIFFGGLRGEALYEAVLPKDGAKAILKTHFKNRFGRIRTVRLGPDGFLYLTTSNTDGRGTPQSGDDKIIRVYMSERTEDR